MLHFMSVDVCGVKRVGEDGAGGCAKAKTEQDGRPPSTLPALPKACAGRRATSRRRRPLGALSTVDPADLGWERAAVGREMFKGF